MLLSSRVFTDIQQVLNNLTHPRFVFTDNEGEADILYNFSHFKDYRLINYRIHCSPDNTFLTFFCYKNCVPKGLHSLPPSPSTCLFCRKLSEERPEVMVNQFPCENLLTVKDCLASIARRAGGPDGPRWLPRTFNLQTELPQFISYFQQRDRR